MMRRACHEQKERRRPSPVNFGPSKRPIANAANYVIPTRRRPSSLLDPTTQTLATAASRLPPARSLGASSACPPPLRTAAVLDKIFKETGADRDHLSASQQDFFARADCIVPRGGGGVEEEEEEAEVFSTPPLTQQDLQRQGQSQRGQAGEGEDGIAMCSMPFTHNQLSSPSSASSSSSDSRQRKPRKPRKCTRKVRAGTKVWPPTPTPSPSPAASATPAPAPAPAAAATATPTPTATASPSPELDPLARIVLMVPTAPLPTTGYKNILELARSRGSIF